MKLGNTMSNILDSNLMNSREADFRTSLNALMNSLQSYKNELTCQERKLEDARSLMLDQLTDVNAASVIRNLTKRLEEKETDLTRTQQKCVELEEKSHSDENELKAKSRHIEKLSSLLLMKEEKIQDLKTNITNLESKIGGLEILVESRQQACEKWKNAAHSAAEKMREHLNTLKASEEMNQELKSLLEKKISKAAENSERNIAASSEALSEEELQDMVPNFPTPGTTAITPSVERKAVTTVSSTCAARNYPNIPLTTDSVSSHSGTSLHRCVNHVSNTSSSPIKTVIHVSRASSLDARSPLTPVTIVEAGSPQNEAVMEEVVVKTVPSEDHCGYIMDLPRIPTVRFQLDECSDASFSGRQYAQIPYPAPIPNFSTLVSDALAENNIHDIVLWKYFIRECVHFYYDLLPTTDSQARNSFFNIGRTLYEKYPVIAKEGPNFKTPWTYFNTCLSSRLRNERFSKRRQSEKRGYILPAEADDTPDSKRARIVMSTHHWQEGCHL